MIYQTIIAFAAVVAVQAILVGRLADAMSR
jgi:hypothetical protein